MWVAIKEAEMNTPGKATLLASAIGIATTLIMVCAPVTVLAAGGIKAAFVEEVIPSHTFFDRTSVLNSVRSIGPGTGVLGVSSITLTNFDTSPQQVFIFAPIFSGGSNCAGSVIGGAGPQMTIYVPPSSTLHLTYPTSLVYNPVDGRTCIAAEVTTQLHGGSVEIDVNGVVN
jgi:hypothetical protein